MRILKTARQLLFIEEDMRRMDPEEEFDIYMFEQAWASTALGFGGMGGSAITTETTFVLIPCYIKVAYVFFGAKFAYKIEGYNDLFIKDLRKHRMASVSESGKYKKNIE